MAPLNGVSLLTIFCGGTDYDSQSKDIIGRLSGVAEGTRGRDWLFVPGPGSNESLGGVIGKLQVAMALTPPGQAIDSVARLARSQTGAQLVDSISGMSVHANVPAAVEQVRALCAPGATVNLAGWSRGAVTCVGIAYALAKDPQLASIRVNMFLFDPVPGPRGLNQWNWTTELGTLTANVQSLAVVLMEDEDRSIAGTPFMAPLTQPFTSAAAGGCGEVPVDRIRIYPMPGAHSSAVETAGDAFAPAARIGAHLCTSYLLDRGTKLRISREPARSSGFLCTPAQLVDAYAALKAACWSRTTGAGRPGRFDAIPNADRDGEFYCSPHHRSVFRELFPVLAQVLDARFDVRRWGAAVVSEARALRASAPAMANLIAGRLLMLLAPAPGLPRFGVQRSPRDQQDLEALLAALTGLAPKPAPAVMAPATTAPPSLLGGTPSGSSLLAGRGLDRGPTLRAASLLRR